MSDQLTPETLLAAAGFAISLAGLTLALLSAQRLRRIKRAWSSHLVGVDKAGEANKKLIESIAALEIDFANARFAERLSHVERSYPQSNRGSGAGYGDSPLSVTGVLDSAIRARIDEFLLLAENWLDKTRIKMLGAAEENLEKISAVKDDLARDTSTFGIERAEKKFNERAQDFAKYLVVATDNKFRDVKPDSVEETISRLLALAGLVQILPNRGDRYDPNIHEIGSDPLAKGNNRSGTVAVVMARGLKGGKKIMKAKVRLYY